MHVVATNHFNLQENTAGCKHGFKSIETMQHEINELHKVKETESKVDGLVISKERQNISGHKMEQKLGRLVDFSMNGSFIESRNVESCIPNSMLHRNKVESLVEQFKKELAFDKGTQTKDDLDITLRGFIPRASSIRKKSFTAHEVEKYALDIAKNEYGDKSIYSKTIAIPTKQCDAASIKCLDLKKTSVKNIVPSIA